MRVVVATPPAPVISTAEAKAHLRVDGSDDDALIDSYIASATAHIDGPAGWLDCAIGVQTLEARLDRLDGDIVLPFPPVVDIVSVSYLTAGGATAVLAPTGYELFGNQLSTAWNASWPATASRREAVRVQYRAGYDVVPYAIRAAILLMVGDLYANRETAVTGISAASVPMSTTVAALLGPFRVFA